MTKTLDLGNGILLGEGHPCVVILDAGVNHNNDACRARELIRTAKEGGASVIKFQTYTAGEISTKSAPRYWNSVLDTDGGKTQYDMFAKVDKLPLEAYADLKAYAGELGIAFSSSPFGLESADFLIKLGIDFYKIASAEMTNYAMIRRVAESGKPIIFSTGACRMEEVDRALEAAFQAGNSAVALQHCVLSYPCPWADANLAKMLELKKRYPGVPVGYSDHTYGEETPLAAVALGARSIEKHYTLDSTLPDSPDHKFSITKDELKSFVDKIRHVEASIGAHHDGYYPAEEKAFKYARRSLVAVRPIRKGEVVREDMLTTKRPGTGIYPEQAVKVIGRTARLDIEEDTVLSWDMLA